MKYTCPGCKRRMKKRPGIRSCVKCGCNLIPFSSKDTTNHFLNHPWETARRVADTFFNARSPLERGKIVSFLKNEVHKEHLAKPLVLCAAHILQYYNYERAQDLFRCLVLAEPGSPIFRSELAYCLENTGSRKDLLEAFKQRILETRLELNLMDADAFRKGSKKVKNDHFTKLRKMEKDIAHTSVDVSGSNGHICEESICSENGLNPFLDDLTDIYKISNLPPVEKKKKDRLLCVLDTNAISNRGVSDLFQPKYLNFIAPVEVLLEISKWPHVEEVPLELDVVEIRDVIGKIPPEIDNMFSKKKGKPPSEADKKVATLAVESGAYAIISDDRDLWDSGMKYAILKNCGVDIKVVRCRKVPLMLKRKGYEIVEV